MGKYKKIQNIDSEKTALLAYPDLVVTTESTDKEYHVFAKPDISYSSACPVCGKGSVQQRGYQERTIHDYILDNLIITSISVIYHQRQFSCTECNHSFPEKIESYKPKATVSERYQRYIYFLCSGGAKSWAQVAKHVNLSFGTVASIHKSINSSLKLIAKNVKSPTVMALSSLYIKGVPYTLIGNLQESTIVGFYQGSPENVLAKKDDDEHFLVDKSLFKSTRVIVVDPKCNYEEAIKERVSWNCKIVVDQNRLYNMIFEDLVVEIKHTLSPYKSKKFIGMLEKNLNYYEQKDYNFINRSFITSNNTDDLKRLYCGLSSLQDFLYSRDKPSYELQSFLENTEYVSSESIDDTLSTMTYSDYFSIDSFRTIAKEIEQHFSNYKASLIPEAIEDAVYYSVPNTIKVVDYTSDRLKCISCFDNIDKDSILLGKYYDNIKGNLNYKNEFMLGNTHYKGPEIIFNY